MLDVRATVIVLTLIVMSGCGESNPGSPDIVSDPNSADTKTSWLLDEIARPEAQPDSPDELVRHIQYAIQEGDKDMLAALVFRIESDGFRLPLEMIDRMVVSLANARHQHLTRIVAKELSADEIDKRNSQTFGMKVPLKLTPEITHEIRFEYQGRVEMGTSRPTGVNVGQHDGVYYIAIYQKGVDAKLP